MKHLVLALLISIVSSLAHAQGATPVVVGGNPMFDACASAGVIVGLDPNGDGFLSVRSGPGGRAFYEKDRLHNGEKVYVCGVKRGPWLPIVYSRSRVLMDNGCNVMTPWPVRQPYTGPCNWGWIHQKYIRITAG